MPEPRKSRPDRLIPHTCRNNTHDDSINPTKSHRSAPRRSNRLRVLMLRYFDWMTQGRGSNSLLTPGEGIIASVCADSAASKRARRTNISSNRAPSHRTTEALFKPLARNPAIVPSRSSRERVGVVWGSPRRALPGLPQWLRSRLLGEFAMEVLPLPAAWPGIRSSLGRPGSRLGRSGTSRP